MHPVEVTGSRGLVRLREFTADDVGALHQVYGDADATRHLSFEPRSWEDVELIVKRILVDARALPRREYAMAVETTEDSTMIGMARLVVGDYRSGQVGFA